MTADVTSPEASPPRLRLRTIWSLAQPFVVLLVVLMAFVVYGWVAKPQSPFLSPSRITTIAKQTATVAVGSLGMTVIIISGGIDLSAGAVIALASVALAKSLSGGVQPELAVLLTLLIGCAAGAINGILVTALRLVPFIVTLGTMLAFRGLAQEVTHETKMSIATPPEWIATLLDPPSAGSFQLVAVGAWIALLLAVLMTLVMRYTVFGRHVLAIGSNEATARLCGVNVPATKIVVYAIGGLFMALAGVYGFSELGGQGDPTAWVGKELDIIAAVVIGGGSLSGGRGSLLGSVLGALSMTAMRTGCVYIGASTPLQNMVIGAIIIAAVAVDQLTQRRGA